jgi:tetratricopeptide (TPR) repeat protein
MRRTIAILSLVLSGCAIHGVGPGAETGWSQVTTPHFKLRTDLDEDTAVEAAKKLEATRDELVSAEWPTFAFPEHPPTEVYVLANGLDFEALFGRMVGGFYRGGTRPAFFLYGSPGHWERRTSLAFDSTSILRHEMVHQLAADVFDHEPRWFAEGLAQFLETVHASEDGKSVVVGALNKEALMKYNTFRTTTLRSVLGDAEPMSTLSDADIHGLYGMSWLFVHWLDNTHRAQLVQYENELVQGTDPARAWGKAFPSFDPDAWESEIYNYSRRGAYQDFTLPLRSTPITARAEKLSPTTTHVARTRVLLASVGFAKKSERDAQAKRASDELAKALAIDPTDVEALELDEGGPKTERLAKARQAVAAHPNDPRAFRLVARLLERSEVAEREAALRQAVKLDPTDPGSLNDLAWLLLEQKKAMEALPLALKAFKRAPNDSAIIDTYAMALFRMGRCQTAVAHEKRALELQRDANRSSQMSAELKEHLAQFKSACTEER